MLPIFVRKPSLRCVIRLVLVDVLEPSVKRQTERLPCGKLPSVSPCSPSRVENNHTHGESSFASKCCASLHVLQRKMNKKPEIAPHHTTDLVIWRIGGNLLRFMRCDQASRFATNGNHLAQSLSARCSYFEEIHGERVRDSALKDGERQVMVHWQELISAPSGFARRQDTLKKRFDDMPDFRPGFRGGPA